MKRSKNGEYSVQHMYCMYNTVPYSTCPEVLPPGPHHLENAHIHHTYPKMVGAKLRLF